MSSIRVAAPRAAFAGSAEARRLARAKEPSMRAHLLVPADDERALEPALKSGADCLWLDLRATPAPGARPRARDLALGLLRAARKGGPHLYVRVNALESGEIDADLDAVMKGAPDGIVLPGAGGGADVQHLGAKLALREAEYDLPDGATQIIAVVQTPAAIFKMGTYAGASRRLAALSWSPDDLAAAIGARATRAPDGALTPPYGMARSLVLMAAKAAGVAAIDCAELGERARFKAECEAACRDGFTGKLGLDAEQVALIAATFRR